MHVVDFEARCVPAAIALEDRLCRYISSPLEHDLALPTLFPLILLCLRCQVLHDHTPR